MLNMFTFNVFSVWHSLGQSVTGIGNVAIHRKFYKCRVFVLPFKIIFYFKVFKCCVVNLKCKLSFFLYRKLLNENKLK